MNEQLLAVARQEELQCRIEGLDRDDTLQMVIGACMRYGRECGLIGEELSNEMRAALAQVARAAILESEPRNED